MDACLVSTGSAARDRQFKASLDNILRDMLVNHLNVGDAVRQTNSYLASQRDIVGNAIMERWEVIGDPSVKIQ